MIPKFKYGSFRSFRTISLALFIGPVELINLLLNKDSLIGAIHEYGGRLKRQIKGVEGRRNFKQERNQTLLNTMVLLLCLLSSVLWALFFAKFSRDCFEARLYIPAVFLALPSLLLVVALMCDVYLGIKAIRKRRSAHV